MNDLCFIKLEDIIVITGATREQDLLTRPEHLRVSLVLGGVRVAQSL